MESEKKKSLVITVDDKNEASLAQSLIDVFGEDMIEYIPMPIFREVEEVDTETNSDSQRPGRNTV